MPDPAANYLKTLEGLVRRLWACEHVAGHDYEVATVDEFSAPDYFGTEAGPDRALSGEEAGVLRRALQ